MLVRPRSLVIVLPLIALLLFCTLKAVNTALGSVIAYPGGEWLYQWQEQPVKLEPEGWEIIRRYFIDSLKYNLANPEILSNLGASYEGEYMYSPVDDETAILARRRARDYYLKALALQPTWPYYWIKLGLVTYHLDLAGDTYFDILRKADYFGPWEPGVQYLIIDIGLHRWQPLTDEQRNFIAQGINKNMLNEINRVSVLQLVLKYGMMNELCRYNGQYLAQVLECKK